MGLWAQNSWTYQPPQWTRTNFCRSRSLWRRLITTQLRRRPNPTRTWIHRQYTPPRLHAAVNPPRSLPNHWGESQPPYVKVGGEDWWGKAGSKGWGGWWSDGVVRERREIINKISNLNYVFTFLLLFKKKKKKTKIWKLVYEFLKIKNLIFIFTKIN